MEEVKLHIPAPADQLPAFLSFSIWLVLSALDDREICVEKTISHVFHEKEEAAQIIPNIVEKDSPDSASLAPMFQKKIFITPFLEAGIVLTAVLITDVFQD
jgi:hypothetical protein